MTKALKNDHVRPAVSNRHEYSYSSSFIPGITVAVDTACILASALICFVALVRYNAFTVEYYIFCSLFITIVTILLFRVADLYSISAIMRPISRSDQIIAAVITAFLLFLSIAFSLKVSDVYSRLWIYSFAGSSCVAVFFGRAILQGILSHLSSRNVIGRSVAVLGVGEQSAQFLKRMNKVKPYFTTLLGVFDPNSEMREAEIEGHPVLGDLGVLMALAREHKVNDVVVAMPWTNDKQLAQTVEALKELPINVYISTDLVGYQLAFRPALGHFNELPMFEVVQRPISGWSYLLKLAVDYILASVLLILLSPLLILVAIAVKIDSPGPALFKQPRLGFNNKEFSIYKFRSMYHGPPRAGVVEQATRHDPRVTRIGRFIRRTSIDELPQLLNVLNGTMSLVGPRPHATSHNREFGRQIRGYFARHNVKPGITGWAQVNGLRGETEAIEKMETRVRHDIYYAENWSLAFDVKIMIMTVAVLFFQKNAY